MPSSDGYLTLGGQLYHMRALVKTKHFKHDLAYGCFAFCGLTALIMSAVEAGLPNRSTALVLVFALVTPLLLVSFPAMLTGIALSLYLWKHWPLLILSGMSLLLSAALATKFGSTTVLYKFITVTYGLTVAYGIVVLLIAGAWFFTLRQRYFPLPME